MKSSTCLRKSAMAVAVASVVLVSPSLQASDAASEDSQPQLMDKAGAAFQNGWYEGKIETALLLNPHLNNFNIDSGVKGSTAQLFGQVSSDIEKDLAEEITLSVDGIETVENHLVVMPEPETRSREDDSNRFVSAIDDASISARVKMTILVEPNLSAFDIDVDTENHVVTLRGEVASSSEKALAEAVVSNIDGVKHVDNQLTVASS